ncbi:MAG: uncharacterized protein JWN44_3268 [Myxococcales bacterium]|nr:uncharacterized protein [Myxococcales bacterium]
MTADRLVINPRLQIEVEDDNVCVRNPFHDLDFRAQLRIKRLLDFCVVPQPRSAIQSRFGLDDKLWELLLGSFVLLREDEVDFLSAGFVRAEPLVVGQRCGWPELPYRARPGAFGIFGVPLDLGSAVESGAREGPRWIRQAMKESYLGEAADAVIDLELRREYDLTRLMVLDVGNIDYVPGEALANVGARIEKLMARLLELEMVPVMLGGDHSLTHYALRALFRHHPRVGVLHFDAHPDHYVGPYRAMNVLNHANPFYFACQSSSLAVLRQLGLRTMERVAPRTRKVVDPRVSYVSAFELQRCTPADAFAGLPRDLPYYLSFDVDCLDPLVAPETGSTVVGGLSYYQALELIDYASQNFNIIGADFVEVSRRVGPVHLACQAVARYLTTLILNSQSFAPVDGYLFQSTR